LHRSSKRVSYKRISAEEMNGSPHKQKGE
jgi:hypothetical protein